MTIHWRFVSDSPRSFWIDGSATFTTVPSRTTMNCAKQMMTSTNHRLVEWRIDSPSRKLPAQSAQPSQRIPPESGRLEYMEIIDFACRVRIEMLHSEATAGVTGV